MYTDCSGDGDRVASTAVFRQPVLFLRLPSASSIFSAEANAIRLALNFVASSDESKFIISSYSLSLLGIASCKTENSFILKIIEIWKSFVAFGKHVIFTWIDHICIHGNTVVDQEAKDALDDHISHCSIPYTDFKTFIRKYILKRWQDSWDQQIYSNLHEIHSLVDKTPCFHGQNRKEQVVVKVILDLLIVLLNNKERPYVIPCYGRLR